MDKNFLVIFNKDGTPKASYVEGIHYTITEQTKEVKPLVDWIDLKKIINEGIFLTTEEHNNIFNNNYIYKDGKIVEKPEYVPTMEEKALAKINEIMAANDEQIADIKDAMLVAVLTNDTELQEELKQEYAAIIEDTNNKLKEVNV